MMPFESRVSQLVRWNAKKGRVYVRTITLDLPAEARDKVGRVFGTLSIEGQAKAGDSLAAFIEDAMTHGLTDALRRMPKDSTQEQVFQTAVAKVNHTLSRILENDGLPVSPEKICGAVVSQKGLEMVAACWGQPSLLLFHPSGAETTIIDLLAESEEANVPYTGGRPASRGFSNMVAGRMGRKDRLVVSTRDLREVFGEEKLRTIISSNDPEAATAVLKDSLAPMGDAVALAVLVADTVNVDASGKARVIAQQERTPENANTSIDKLLTTESATKDMLSPPFLPSLMKRIGGWIWNGAKAAAALLVATAKSAFTAPEPQKPNIVTEESSVELGARLEWVDAAPKARFPRLHGAGKAALAVALFLPSLFSRERRADISASFDRRTDLAMNAVIGWFNGQSSRSRALLFLALGLLLTLNLSVVGLGLKRQSEEKVAAYERAVAAVEQKIDSSEASLIYRDEERTKILLTEAGEATEALPEKTEQEKAVKEGLRQKIALAKEELRHVVALPAPEVVASIVGENGDVRLRKLAVDAGVIWTASEDGELYKIAAEGGAAAKTASAPQKDPNIFLVQPSGLLVGGDGALAFVTKAGKSSARTVDWAGTEAVIDDAALFSSRLYVLDASHNRILRLPATEKGFAKPQFYLKDGTDLSGGVSLAIDGSVYVLSKNGEIVRLEQGVRMQFGVQRADPPVTAAARLRTTEKSESLYVLEPGSGRILRFNKKSGGLTAQYTADALKEADDFVVDEKAKTILAAAGNRVIKFAVPEAK